MQKWFVISLALAMAAGILLFSLPAKACSIPGFNEYRGGEYVCVWSPSCPPCRNGATSCVFI